MSNPITSGLAANSSLTKPTVPSGSNTLQAGVNKAATQTAREETEQTDPSSDAVLLKAKRTFTGAPLQRDVRVVQKGEEIEATRAFASFALQKKWVTKLDPN